MMGLKYTKGIAIGLKGHPSFDEAWVKERIIEDTSILGLGNLRVRNVERTQKYGRLDLLLVNDEDDEEEKWYEVEVQLGPTNESHIIRTLEYWDEEQRRYPNHRHCAVLVAEDVTGRFLNVTSLFNRYIPLIAIQMHAIQVQEYVVLNFAKILDTLEPEDEDEGDGEEKIATKTNREYWQSRSSEISLQIMDKCFDILKQISPDASPNYKQQFVGVIVDGRANNFVYFHPKKQPYLRVHVRPSNRDEWIERLKSAGIEVLEGGKRSVRFRLRSGEPQKQHDLLTQLFQDSYQKHIA